MARKRNSGWRRVTLYPHNGRFYAHWTDPLTGKGRSRSLKTTERSHALKKVKRLEEWLNQGLPMDDAFESLGVVDVRQAVDKYLDHKKLMAGRETKHVRDVLPYTLEHMVRFLKPKTPIGEITSQHLAAFSNVCLERDDLTASYKRMVLNHARACLRWLAGKYPISDALPNAIVSPSPPRRREIRTFTEDEIKAALSAASSYSEDALGLVLMPLVTGLRASEVIRLLWADVDLASRSLRVDTHDPDPDKGIVGATTKCETSRRVVPLEEPLLSWLREHRQRSPGPYVFMHRGQMPKERGLRGALAITLDPGKRKALQERIAQISKEAPGEYRPYISFPRRLIAHLHKSGCPWDGRIARHTFATIVAKQGQVIDRATDQKRPLTLFDLQRLMGHASVKTTERHYLGYFDVGLDLGLGDAFGVASSSKKSHRARGKDRVTPPRK